MSDLIDRQAAIDVLNDGTELLRRTLDYMDLVGTEREKFEWGLGLIESYISDMKELPSAQPKNCEGCKHLGKWEDELEYGYPSPCTRCKRMVGDHYER